LVVALALLAAPLSVGQAFASPAAALTGVVTLKGSPVAGATVTVTALPLPGTEWPTQYRATPLAIGRTGVTGHFTIPLDVSGSLAYLAAQVNSDTVNMWVQAFYNAVDNVGTVNDPNTIVDGGKGTAYGAADLAYTTVVETVESTPAGDVVATVLSTPDPVALELTAYQAAEQAQMTGTSLAAPLLGPASDPGGGGGSEPCRSTYAPIVTVEDTETDFQPVGEGHVMYDSTGSFAYGEHANTDLDGAYKIGGGAWDTTAGASHMGNKKAMVTKDFVAYEAVVVTTGFRYRKERVEFTDDQGDKHVCRTDHRIVPETWVGGGIDGADVSSHDSYGQMDAARGKEWADPFGKGYGFVKNMNKGEKYKIGVTAFGIGLTAQSEWSAQVDMTWKFGRQTDQHWLYGSNDPIKAAATVYAW
jgi:hypothetical protein